MEARVAVLEQIAEDTSETLKGIRQDMRDYRDKQEHDFRIGIGVTATTAIGLAALIAKGFQWL